MDRKIVPHKHPSGCWAIGEGGSSFTREIVLVNPSERDGHRCTMFVLWFGACGATYLAVWARGIEDAIEEAGAWLADHAPGHVMAHGGEEHTLLVKEACEDAGLAWPMPDDWMDRDDYVSAVESAESDLTYTESGYLTSYEWGIVSEDPSRDVLIALVGGA